MLPLFLQINCTSEVTKGGFSEEEFFRAVDLCSSFSLLGVMTMAEHTTDETRVRSTFRKARTLASQANLPGCSMGMSGDYQIALEEGASVIRVGRALFV